MIVLKKTIRYVFRFVLGFICFVLLYLAMSWLFPYIKTNTSFKSPVTGIDIYIHSNGVHTDLVIPVKTEQLNWNQFLPVTDFKMVDSTYEYVAIGWGDKGFYLDTKTWDDLKFSTVFNAAFGLGSTAMHVSYKKQKPKIDAMTKHLLISKAQYQSLIEYIVPSFQLKAGKPIWINHEGYTSQDCFYEANGRYSMFKTCNVWTGNGLQHIGVKIGIWTPFQNGIIGQLE
jgi:uncharacterized protein (TIGR02117 family)